MKRREKKMTMKILFIVIAALALGTVFVPYYTPAVDAATWIVNLVDFFTDIKTNIGTDINVIGLSAAIFAVGYYFLVYRPKTSR